MIESIIIVALVIIFYAETINYLLVVDDITQYHLLRNGQVCKLKVAGFVRWIKYKLYGFGGIFGVDNTSEKTQRRSIKLDHAVTITIHSIISILIYFALGKNNISFCAALLYSIHPINHQTSIWANGRRYAINILLVLIMLILPKPLGLLAWICTPFLHLTAVFAPLLMGWKYAVAIPVAGAIAWHWQYKDYKMRLATQKTQEMLKYSLKRIVPSVKLYGFYLLRSVWPGRVMLVYPHLYFWGLNDKGTKDAHSLNLDFYKGVSAITITVIVLYFLHGQERLYFTFAVLSIVQWCGFVSVTQHSCDRYTSCATPFMMYLTCFIAFNYLGIYALPAVVFLLGVYISELSIVKKMYRSIIEFHEHHNFFYRENIISRQAMIHGMMAERQPLKAWYEVQEALKHQPGDMRINLLASEICLCMLDKPRAQYHLDQAIANVYDGQQQSQQPCFDDIQRRINGIKVENKYSPKLRTPPKRIFASV